jgi:2,3-bisphosphoglycerate-dependent phosphoglycerate mutase
MDGEVPPGVIPKHIPPELLDKEVVNGSHINSHEE